MINDYIQDYCSSEYFLFLDSKLKDHAESILSYWCDKTGNDPSLLTIESTLKNAAHLNLDVDTKRNIPVIIKEFYTFLSRTGKIPQADIWINNVNACDAKYQIGFRNDGSIRGETHVKKYCDVGRNDLCPCGSGKKFKKCCMGLIN
jgi:hypothetical protein